MIDNSNIPKHWQLKKLGEVCHTTSGGTPSRQKSSYYNGNIPWVKSGELDKGLIMDTEEKISEESVKNSSAKIFPKGTLLIALYGATIGKLAFLGVDAATNQAICGIFKNDNIDSNYLYHFLFYKKPNLVKQGIGGAQPNISQGILKNLDLPIPPIPEQQAIVAKIEELLSELENGKQQLLNAQQQLKAYRQSMLNLIVTGKNHKTIDSVIEKLDQGWSPKCLNESSKDENEWAVIKTSAVQNGHFVAYENKILPKDLKPREQHELKAGDILITRAGPRIRVGICCLVRKTRLRLINCDKVYRIKVNPKIISPEYLELILNTPFYQREIEKMKSGISDSGLNLTQSKFLKIEIPIPTPEEQQFIVSELESKITVCDKIEETISKCLQQAETLKQSILKKAFEGKLL
jgi:type I restriction enzyme S subunit